jgi:hypothetical protein
MYDETKAKKPQKRERKRMKTRKIKKLIIEERFP